MTDKEKLHQILSSLWKNDDSVGKVYYNQALQDVQTAIDLQEEPVNNGLDLGCGVIWKGEEPISEELEDAASKFDGSMTCVGCFIGGAQWQKQQMMAKAIDAVVKIDAGGYPYVDRTIELYDYDKDIPLAKRGDKVKMILIKED